MPDSIHGNIQPVHQAAGTQTPSLPAPQQPGFMNADPASLIFDFDDSGNLMLTQPNQAPAPTQQTDVRFQDAVAETQTTTPQQLNQGNAEYDDRFSKIENAVFGIATYLQGMQGGNQQNLSSLNNQPPQEQTPEIDFQSNEWPKQIVSLINSSIEKAFEAKFAPTQKNLQEVNLRMEFQDAAMKYGQPFMDLLPAMAEIKRSDPNMSWDVLYSAFSKVKNPQGKTSNSDSTTQPVNGSTPVNGTGNGQPQQVNKQELIDRARQMATETQNPSRSLISDTPKRFTSLNDAFEDAYQKVVVGVGR